MIENDALLDDLKQHPVGNYASPIARAVAAGIDLGLLTVLQFLSAAALAGALGYHPATDVTTGAETTYLIFSPALITALVLAYFPGQWAWRGRTPGMQLLGLRLLNEDATRLDLRTAAFRFGALLLALAPALVGLLVAFTDQRRQAFHDRLARTVVVEE